MGRFVRRILSPALVAVLLIGALLVQQSGTLLRTALERGLQPLLVPTLRIGAPVEWRLLPQPGLTLRAITLTEADGSTPLVLREAELSLAIDAAARHIMIDVLDLTGLELALTKAADHGWNAAGWLAPRDAATSGSGVAVTVGRLHLREASVRVVGPPDDRASGGRPVDGLRLDALEVAIEALQPGVAAPFTLAGEVRIGPPAGLELRLDTSGALTIGEAGAAIDALRVDGRGRSEGLEAIVVVLGAERIELGGTDGSASASAIAWQIAAEKDGFGPLRASGTLSRLTGTAQAWRSGPIELSLEAAPATGSLTARLDVDELAGVASQWSASHLSLSARSSAGSPPLELTLAARARGEGGTDALPWPGALTLEVASATLRTPHPSGSGDALAIEWSGRLQAALASAEVDAVLDGRFDDSRFEARASYRPGTALPVRLDAAVDRLALDRYLPPAQPDGPPPDLTSWRRWPVEAELRIEELKLGELTAQDGRIRLRGGDMPLTVAP